MCTGTSACNLPRLLPVETRHPRDGATPLTCASQYTIFAGADWIIAPPRTPRTPRTPRYAEEMQRRCRGTEMSHRAHRAHGVSERKRIIALSSLFPVSSVISVVQFSVLLRDLSAKLCALCVKDLVRPSRETGVRWYNIYCVPATWHFVRPLFPGCSHREYLPPVRLFSSEERVFLRHSMSLGF
jgi:hypothetical protein